MWSAPDDAANGPKDHVRFAHAGPEGNGHVGGPTDSDGEEHGEHGRQAAGCQFECGGDDEGDRSGDTGPKQDSGRRAECGQVPVEQSRQQDEFDPGADRRAEGEAGEAAAPAAEGEEAAAATKSLARAVTGDLLSAMTALEEDFNCKSDAAASGEEQEQEKEPAPAEPAFDAEGVSAFKAGDADEGEAPAPKPKSKKAMQFKKSATQQALPDEGADA